MSRTSQALDIEIDDEEQETPLTQDEHLEAILFQFVSLYERWSEDRQKSAKQGADIEKFIKQFASEIDRFSKIEDAVIAKLKKGLEQTTENVSSMVQRSVSHAVDEALGHAAEKVRESARYAENVYSEYQSSLSWSHWKLIFLTVLSSIVVSLLIVLWLMPNPVAPLTDRQMVTYHNGVIFNGFWDKISRRQQQWLLNVAEGKENKEKLVEEFKKQYRDVSDEQAYQLIK